MNKSNINSENMSQSDFKNLMNEIKRDSSMRKNMSEIDKEYTKDLQMAQFSDLSIIESAKIFDICKYIKNIKERKK